MKGEERDRVRTGLSKSDLEDRVPDEKDRKAVKGDFQRVDVVREARAKRVGRDTEQTILFENSQPTDCIVVGALISNQYEPMPESAIATGLRWPPARVETALNDLQRRLLMTGQRLARFDDGSVEVRPAFEYLDESHVTRTFAASIKDAGLNRQQLGILYRFATYAGKGRFIDGKPDLMDPNVRILLEFGFLIENGTRIEVSNHVRYSLTDERVELPYSPRHNALLK